MALIVNNVSLNQVQGEPAVATTSNQPIIEGAPAPQPDLSDFSPGSDITLETVSPKPTPEQQWADANARMEAFRYGLGPLRVLASAALEKTEQLNELVSVFAPELDGHDWDISVDANGDTVVLGERVTGEQAAFLKSASTSLGLEKAMSDYLDGVLEMIDISRSGSGTAGTWDVTADNFKDVFRFREFLDLTQPPTGPFGGSTDGTYLSTYQALLEQLSARASRVPTTGISAYI
ncbi:hypothetical protein [Saccharospirillum mangrovi]|uniref:hypothetical protein n=1 Tax=Saccharospirillum mangrovi TaxID=2161747 RepID=UPI000D39FEC8|nr:hypothetical protein [Saccharospirillum mangrovi]